MKVGGIWLISIGENVDYGAVFYEKVTKKKINWILINFLLQYVLKKINQHPSWQLICSVANHHREEEGDLFSTMSGKLDKKTTPPPPGGGEPKTTDEKPKKKVTSQSTPLVDCYINQWIVWV